MTTLAVARPNNRNRTRALLTLIVAVGFLILAATGLLMLFGPERGETTLLTPLMRPAHEIHEIASIAFLAVGVWHVARHWRTLMRHVRTLIDA
ncbi:DUF4405 domain-containing protein [Roseospirillum parvum]|uniref:Flavinylation-associated cytochrome domain-containing protein n=1 Tax=Roseospirillum parvum TaxID=83401 RepID=A0A1G7ZNK5_9PROT|nr:DUF4405 domain-containing protein [Roseospirillum parvum]SDH10157.1 protein of unknown function [Roseospirillum parvum]